MDRNELQRLAGILHKDRDTSPVGLFSNLGHLLKRTSLPGSKETIAETLRLLNRLEKQFIRASVDEEIYHIKRLAGLFEEEDEKQHYGQETNRNGQEMDRDSGMNAENYKSELASIHGEMLTCWADLRKCIMTCLRDGADVPDAMRSTIDKISRNIENIENLAGKV